MKLVWLLMYLVSFQSERVDEHERRSLGLSIKFNQGHLFSNSFDLRMTYIQSIGSCLFQFQEMTTYQYEHRIVKEKCHHIA